MPDPRDRLIVALDVGSAAEARRIVGAVGEAATAFKVGKQLFTAEGPQVVRDLVASGRKVFLDLKYHDIPNTVAAAVGAAAGLGVSMLSVHASGGMAMLRAAAQAAGAARTPPLVLAVTVLTSLGDADLQEIGVRGRTQDQALRLAALAQTAGCDGVVASPHEVRQLRQSLGTGFVMVTPGVRPLGADKGDQARVATPADAIAAGADYIVVGRPITQAANPAVVCQSIMAEIASSQLG